MKVYTESGSYYAFTVFENSLRMLAYPQEIIVESIENLKVGDCMIVRGHKLTFYNQVGDEVYLKTSPIKSIEP